MAVEALVTSMPFDFAACYATQHMSWHVLGLEAKPEPFCTGTGELEPITSASQTRLQSNPPISRCPGWPAIWRLSRRKGPEMASSA
jgi:hypothetical protein